mgnify:CR=1 FL=1
MATTPPANPAPAIGSKFFDSEPAMKKISSTPFLRVVAILFAIAALVIGGIYWLGTQSTADRQTVALDALTNPDSDALQRRINQQLFGDDLVDVEGIGADIDNTLDPNAMQAKLAGLTKNVTTERVPTEQELRLFYALNKDNYRNPSLFWLSVETFTTARHGGQVFEKAQQALESARQATLESGSSSAVPEGDSHDRYARISSTELAERYGPSFVASLMQASKESAALPCWHGPISSPQGANLVCVREVLWGDYPALVSIKDQVINDWRFSVK